MSLPIAHAVVGASIAVLLWPASGRRGLGRPLLSGAVLGVLPDADYLINAARVLGPGWHHGFTHSIVFAVVVGALASWALGLRTSRGAAACSAALLSHALMDFLFTDSHGIALFWPVTNGRFSLGAGMLNYYWVAGFRRSGAVLGWLRLCAFELLAFGPLLVVAVLLHRRRLRSPRAA